MDRIKINLPEHFSFSTMITIRITDLNYGGHVGNDSFLSLIHEARQQFLQHYGFAELSFAGTGLIMADVGIEYKRELNHRDQVKISVAAANFDKLGFDIFYKLELADGETLALAGKAKTGMMCYDYDAKKKMPVPEEAMKLLNSNV
jgi:acyl-CoA thioester hydrolase